MSELNDSMNFLEYLFQWKVWSNSFLLGLDLINSKPKILDPGY